MTSFVVLAATTVAAPAQTFKTLVSFNGTDGVYPMYAPLVQGRDRNFYGTTRGAGGNNPGTVFKVTAGGKLTTVTLGLLQPYSGLVLATNGNFYGPTAGGGTSGDGTVFSLSTGLGPFVTFAQRAVKVEHTAEIVGQGFKGTTKVSFNGTPAIFTVQTDTFLTATVPAGRPRATSP